MPAHQSLGLSDGMRESRLTYSQLWELYLGLGGSGSLTQLRHHIEADQCPDGAEHNIIAQALNDVYVADGGDHPVAYQHLHRLDPPASDGDTGATGP